MPIVSGGQIFGCDERKHVHQLLVGYILLDSWCEQHWHLHRMHSEFEFARRQHVRGCVFVQRGVFFSERKCLSELCSGEARDVQWLRVWLSVWLCGDARRQLFTV